jgi:hypothetical protein
MEASAFVDMILANGCGKAFVGDQGMLILSDNSIKVENKLT